jgi:hypothetical protein
MFGTFEPEKESVRYGLVKNVNTFNPVTITFMGWKAILEDIKRSKSFSQAFHLFFGPPNTRSKEMF